MFEFIVDRVDDIIYLLERDTPDLYYKYSRTTLMRIIASIYTNNGTEYDLIKGYVTLGNLTEDEPTESTYKVQLEPELWFFVK